MTLLLALLCTACFLGNSAAEAVEGSNSLKKSKINVLNSETLDGNLLPNFLFMQGAIEGGSIGVNIGGGKGTLLPFVPDESCGDDMFERPNPDLRAPQLPYLSQDLWTCERKSEDIEVYAYENDELLVYITPQYDGKIWSVYDKKREKELMYRPRAHQPANIAGLKAWAAGGCEWNWSPGITGHSAFSETRVYTAKMETKKGTVVRVYEFDRYNGTTWQVDMLLQNDTLYVHPRITNPTETDLPGYWWTSVAIDAKPSTRILSPASHVSETSRDDMRNAPWPVYAEAIENASFLGYKNQFPTDNSWLGNNQIGDMFLRIEKDDVYMPFVGSSQEDDNGFIYIHAHPLNGTKFYTWGQSGPGRFMQDFLAGGGKRQGDYTELQVGVAPSQMNTFLLPKKTVKEWTEVFKGFDAKEDIVRGDDYKKAMKEIDDLLKSPDGVPKNQYEDIDSFFNELGNEKPTDVIVTGQPWGALEEMLLGTPLAKGLVFTMPEKDSKDFKLIEQWVELLQDGAFSDATLKTVTPLSFQTTDRWLKVIEDSAAKFGMTWLHALHLGIAYTERGDVEKPLRYFQTSMDLKPNVVAARCIALLQQNRKDSWSHYQTAWRLARELKDSETSATTKDDKDRIHRLILNLVTEVSFFLQQELWYDEMQNFESEVMNGNYLDGTPLDAFETLKIKNLMHKGENEKARSLLSEGCFPTYAKARDDLMNMWNGAVMGIAAKKKGSELTNVEAHQARLADKIPENIGCVYATEYCYTYW